VPYSRKKRTVSVTISLAVYLYRQKNPRASRG
jgi:hypothetical protein